MGRRAKENKARCTEFAHNGILQTDTDEDHLISMGVMPPRFSTKGSVDGQGGWKDGKRRMVNGIDLEKIEELGGGIRWESGF